MAAHVLLREGARVATHVKNVWTKLEHPQVERLIDALVAYWPGTVIGKLSDELVRLAETVGLEDATPLAVRALQLCADARLMNPTKLRELAQALKQDSTHARFREVAQDLLKSLPWE